MCGLVLTDHVNGTKNSGNSSACLGVVMVNCIFGMELVVIQDTALGAEKPEDTVLAVMLCRICIVSISL